MKQLTIAPMSPLDVELALDWAAREGWNPGLHDAIPFRAADPEGFLIARRDDQPVGMIAAIRYGHDFGFIGLYIVRPADRGHGYGWATWSAGMRHLEGRVVGLDGVIAQQGNYQRQGFVLHHRNIRYEGRRTASAASPEAAADIVPLSSLPFNAVDDYDGSFFPAGRSAFLSLWITQPGTQGRALVRGGRLAGYGVIRPCRSGYKIGPLFAETSRDAERLYASLCSTATDNATIALDVPACNADAIRLAERHQMKPIFETARMYTGAAPDMALDRTFGITSFELG